MRGHRYQDGFTIVELLIVVVVIAILAAITIVSYNGISSRAKDSALRNDLENATKVVETYRYLGGGNSNLYPATQAAAGLPASSSSTFTYYSNAAGTAYCLSAYNGTNSYITTSDNTTIRVGECSYLNGLVGWWKMDGDATDATGTTSAATVSGATLTTGQNGQANSGYLFNGSAYLQVPTVTYDLSQGFTISVWAQPTASGSWARFMDFGNGNGPSNIVFARSLTSADLALALYNATGGNLANVSASGVIINNSWHLYTVTMTSGYVITFYRDGVLQATSGGALPLTVARTSNYIGKSNWGSDALYVGSMDDMRIYNRALSATELQQLYLAGAQ